MRTHTLSILILIGLIGFTACRKTSEPPLPAAIHSTDSFALPSPGIASVPQEGNPAMQYEIVKTEEEWRKLLTPDQYSVAREKGTERAFTGEYWNNKKEGVYHCVCCGQELFDSKSKFDSGTGWPSFGTPMHHENVRTESDYSHGMVRTEVLCSRCGAHLGHVFNDGPHPTGLRYCINSISLQFKENQ